MRKNNKTQPEKHTAEIMSTGKRRQSISGVALLLLFAMIIPSLQLLAQQPRVIRDIRHQRQQI